MTTIASKRTAAGLTQQALADTLGVTQAAVANWEHGRRCPPVKTLRRIAAALGCTIADLIDDTPPAPPGPGSTLEAGE